MRYVERRRVWMNLSNGCHVSYLCLLMRKVLDVWKRIWYCLCPDASRKKSSWKTSVNDKKSAARRN